jgi:predicted lipid-binding transport protein (Tim44 family)
MTVVILALLGGVVGGALLSDFGGFVFGAVVGALAGWVLDLGGRVRALERRLEARKTDARAPAEELPPPRSAEASRAPAPVARPAEPPGERGDAERSEAVPP